MDFKDFTNLIRINSEKGRKTEFFKLQLSIDDYRKSKPADFGIEEIFFADYDEDKKNYTIYYPDKENEIALKKDDIEDEFYDKGWDRYIHK